MSVWSVRLQLIYALWATLAVLAWFPGGANRDGSRGRLGGTARVASWAGRLDGQLGGTAQVASWAAGHDRHPLAQHPRPPRLQPSAGNISPSEFVRLANYKRVVPK